MSLAFWRSDTDGCKRLSHWAGTGLDDAAWREQGRAHRALVHELCTATDQPFPSWVLEWGCGGGMNAVAFADREYSAVDVSERNIEEARRQYVAAGGVKWTACRITASGKSVDLFLSTATFQHFPSRRHGARVLRAAYRVLRPEGLGLVQVRTYARALPGDTLWPDFDLDLAEAGFSVVRTWTNVGRTPGDYVYYGFQR